MGNPLEAVGHEIAAGAKEVAHVTVETGKVIFKVAEFLPRAERVLAAAIENEPVIKEQVLNLVKQAAVVIADLGGDVAAKGVDLSADFKTMHDAGQFFQFFKTTFIPAVESIYHEVEKDVAS